MDLSLVRFLSQSFSASVLSVSRPGLTFVGIQWTIGLLVRLDVLALTPGLDWLVSLPAMLVAAVLGGLETAARHSEAADEILRELKISHLLGSFGAFSSVLLFASLGLPEDEALDLIGDTADADLGWAVQQARAADQPAAVQGGAVVGAVGIHGLLAWANDHIQEFIAEFVPETPQRIYQILLTGSPIALLAAVFLMPYIAAAFLLLSGLVLGAVAFAVWGAQKAADVACRVPCEHCEHRVRPEARRCPECQCAIRPQEWLDDRSMVTRGWAAARDRLAARRLARER